ncbi:hypothetical protein AB595_11840 [Massilia sp. WF1]|uniref:hypothetical protein n=1 Tax=unclassified Massilia TaxID=2609279 RepID=UPI00064AA87A|nr:MULTISPECIES: hypothetical protein [unclassified Massilia]ALK97301.1 hypothetical protein AM586_14720 [Massilia sp. WG5]KLU36482.1 hypothetical protein AB595_11840 [Massilia sp. WF1]
MKVSCLPPLLALSLLSVTGAALADDAAILKCRSLGDQQARLACYDGMPLGAGVPGAAAAPAAANAEQRFGLEQVKTKEATPQSIESTIPGEFSGWEPGAQIHLANGQVWRVIDGSSAVLSPMKNPQVKVTRNTFGTLFLEIEGTNNSPKVRRIR